jgi:hypothetical protein
MSDRVLHAQRMALDFDGWQSSLPEPQRQSIDAQLRQYPDPQIGKRMLTNSQWIIEQEKLNPRAVVKNYQAAMAGYAAKHGWGDVGNDESTFYGRLVKDATEERDEQTVLRGFGDDEVPMIPEKVMPGSFGSGAAVIPARRDTETARKSREESLLYRAYWSAAEQEELMDPQAQHHDMILGFRKWQEARRGTPGYRAGQEDKYFQLWEAQYRAGEKDKVKAIETINSTLQDIAVSADTDSEQSLTKAVDALEKLTPQQRGLALAHIAKAGGKQEGLPTTSDDKTSMETAKATGAQSLVAFGRAIKNLGGSMDRGARRGTFDLTFKPGDTVPAQWMAEGVDRVVSGHADIGMKPGKHGWVGQERLDLTEAQAKALNEAAEKRMARIDLEGQVINAAQGIVMPIQKDSILKIAGLTAVESLPAMALAGTGVGMIAAYDAYRNDAYENLISTGVPRKEADAMSPFIGAAQAALDRVQLGFLKKVPGVEGFLSKWTQNAAIRAGVRFTATTAAETGIELTQDQLVPALVQDVGSWLSDNVPSVNWKKVQADMEKSTPETLVGMMLLSALGAGHAHLRDMKGADALVRDPKALELLGLNKEQIDNIVYASDGKAGDIFREEFGRRVPLMPGDTGNMTPGEAVEFSKKNLREGKFPPISPVGAPPGPEDELAAPTDVLPPDGPESALFPETPPEEQPEFDIFGTFQEPGLTASATNDALRRDEAQINADAGVVRMFRDDNGWHLEMAQDTPGQARFIDAGSAEAAIRIRDGLAVGNLREQLEELKEETEKVAKEIKEVAKKAKSAGELVGASDTSLYPGLSQDLETIRKFEESDEGAKGTRLLTISGALLSKEKAATLSDDRLRDYIEGEVESIAAYQRQPSTTPGELAREAGTRITLATAMKEAADRGMDVQGIMLKEAKKRGMDVSKALSPRTSKKIAGPTSVAADDGPGPEALTSAATPAEGADGGLTIAKDSPPPSASQERAKSAERVPPSGAPPTGLTENAGKPADVKESELPDFGSTNRVFTKEKAEKAKKNLREKFGRTMMGVDPTVITDGIQLGGYILEGGIRKFGAWSAEMVKQLGDGIKPHLRQIYEALRHAPEAKDIKGSMTPESEMEAEGAAAPEPTEKGDGKPSRSKTPALTEKEQKNLDEGATGTKNAVTDALREKLGLPAPEELTEETHPEVLAEAMRRMTSAPNLQEKLIKELANAPRALQAYEEAILMHANLQAEDAVNKGLAALKEAEATGDPQVIAEAEGVLDDAREKAEILFNIERATGTIWGRTGNFRRRMMHRDFTLAKMESLYRAAANKGGSLNEGQKKLVLKFQSRLDELAKSIAEQTDEVLKAKVEEAMDQYFGMVSSVREQAAAAKKEALLAGLKQKAFSAREWLREKAKNASARNKERSAQLGSGGQIVGVTIDSLIIAADIIADKVTSLAEFTARITKILGKGIEPYAKRLFEAGKETLDAIMEADAPPEKAATKRRKDAAKERGAALAEAENDAVAAKEDGDGLPTQKVIYGMVKSHVTAGLKGLDAVAAAHKDLEPLYPGLTERQVREILITYGIPIKPNPEATATEMRLIGNLTRLTLQLEDVRKQALVEKAKRELPPKTGRQRDKPTPTERALQKEINREKKKLGISRASEGQLASALDAAKTRMKNAAEDVQALIDKGGRTAEERAPNQAKLAALRESLAALEGRSGKAMTEEERIKATLTGLERTEEMLERQILTGKKPDAKAAPVNNDAIEEKRSYVATLRRIIKEQNDELNPPLTGDEKAEQAKLRAYERAAEHYGNLLASGDITVKGKKVGVDSEAVAKAKEIRDDLKEEWEAYRKTRIDDINLAKDKRMLARRTEKLKEKLDELKRTGVVPAKPSKRVKKVDEVLGEMQVEFETLQRDWTLELFEAMQKSRSNAQIWRDRVINTFITIPRFLKMGVDLGVIALQGGMHAGAFPLKTYEMVKQMLGGLANEPAQLRAMLDLKKDPDYALMVRSGVEFTDPFAVSPTQMEEMFQIAWAEKLPPRLRNAMRRLHSAFSIYANQARVNIFKTHTSLFSRTGFPTEKEAIEAARIANIFTGRGMFPDKILDKQLPWRQATPALNQIFLAPRWVYSRWQMAVNTPLAIANPWHGTPRAKAATLALYGRALSSLAFVYLLYGLTHSGDDDDKVVFDPRSSNFGKLRFGDAYLDPLAGIGQIMTLVARGITGETLTKKGEIKAIRGKDVDWGAMDADATMFNFLRYRLSPFTGAMYSGLWAHENPIGEPTNVFKELALTYIPLSGENLYDAMREHGIPKGAALFVAAFVGWNLSRQQERSTEDIDNEASNWLTRNSLFIPNLSKNASLHSLSGTNPVTKQKEEPLTDGQREQLLKLSTPAIEKEAKEMRGGKYAKDTPEFKQKNFERTVKAARVAALTKLRETTGKQGPSAK